MNGMKLPIKKFLTNTLLVCFVALPFYSISQENSFIFHWKDGFKLESVDKQFNLKFGGRIMYDMACFFQDDTLEDLFGHYNNGNEFRRARFYSAGQVYGNVKYKLQLDFAGGSIGFKDAYIDFAKVPGIGNFRVGHFKEPFRLEALTSSKYMTFMERSMHMPFSQERNSGFMIFNSLMDDKVGYQLGVFRAADEYGNDKDANDGYSITSRISALPINNSEANHLLHIGAAYSYRKPDSRTYEVQTRAENHLGPKYVSTGTIDSVDNIGLIGGELAWVKGPLSIQGEVVMAGVNQVAKSTAQDNSFMGFYGQVSYFLTGESRSYKNYMVGFSRVKPNNNMGGDDGGIGALELALRYSGINLEDENILGGEMSNIGIGLNWHFNPVTRVMINYIMTNLSSDNNEIGSSSVYQMRFQVDF